jgi:hypothetical protein
MTGARGFEWWFPAGAAYNRSRSGVDRSIFFATTALKLLTALNSCDRAIRWPAQQEDRLQSILAIVPITGMP